MTIGDRIKQLRESLGLTRADLARRAGMPYATLAGLENGDQDSTTRLHAIAAALGVSATWLDSGSGSKDEVREPGQTYSSQSARPDFKKIGAAIQILQEFLAIRGEPMEWATDPVMLEVAYEVVDEFAEPVAPSNILMLTKRLAEKRRNVGTAETGGSREAASRAG